MKLTYVDELPKKSGTKLRLQALIDEFVKSNREIAKIEIEDGHYKSIMIARGCIDIACRRSGHPVKVAKRGNNLYLVRAWVLKNKD